MSRVSAVAERIRLMILRGDLGPGGRLVDVQLAARLDAGRSSVREALRRLEGEGLLVADASGGMHLIRVDERELEATLAVRAALEPLAARLAAARVREGLAPAFAVATLRELAEAADATRRTIPPDRAARADRNFHRAIAALAENEPCHAALEHVWDRILIAVAHGTRGAQQLSARDAEHPELLRAILAGDEEDAAQRAHRHVRRLGPDLERVGHQPVMLPGDDEAVLAGGALGARPGRDVAPLLVHAPGGVQPQVAVVVAPAAADPALDGDERAVERAVEAARRAAPGEGRLRRSAFDRGGLALGGPRSAPSGNGPAPSGAIAVARVERVGVLRRLAARHPRRELGERCR